MNSENIYNIPSGFDPAPPQKIFQMQLDVRLSFVDF